MKDALYLYTLSYPFGEGEGFIAPEIPYLAKAFSKVHIIPLRYGGKERDTPSNVTVHQLEALQDTPSLAQTIKMLRKADWRPSFLLDMATQWSQARQHIRRAEALERTIAGSRPAIHYSYWLDDWATVLSLLSLRGVIDGYVSRAHGFDLYEERHSLSYFPYREFQLSQAKMIFPISDLGASYLMSKHPDFSNIERAYLGTEDMGLARIPVSSKMLLLSVSSIIPLKRVELIARLHSLLDENVHWRHIGGGDTAALRLDIDNERTGFLGQLPRNEVLQLLKEDGISAFINLSTTEGIPVSMMEAISMGIPIIATDVGGVSEIVNENTGHLVHADVPLKALADFINSRENDRMFDEGFRTGVRAFWKENFSAAKNYPAFCKKLKEL